MERMNHQESSPWIRSDIEVWKDLIADKTPMSYKKNSMIFSQEQPSEFVYIVASGRVRITFYGYSGAQKHIYIADVGTMIGDLAFLQGSNQVASAIAISDCEIYMIPYQKLQVAMRENWSVMQALMESMCRKTRTLMSQIITLSFSDSTQRVAQSLLNLASVYGVPTRSGTRIAIKFTHQDMAYLINSSRVTVSKVFGVLSEKGIIFKQDGFFTITDKDYLFRMVQGEPCE